MSPQSCARAVSKIKEKLSKLNIVIKVKSERFNAKKTGLIHHFLHLKMPVPSQEYDSSCPFVFDAFCYLILPCDYGLSE